MDYLYPFTEFKCWDSRLSTLKKCPIIHADSGNAFGEIKAVREFRAKLVLDWVIFFRCFKGENKTLRMQIISPIF